MRLFPLQRENGTGLQGGGELVVGGHRWKKSHDRLEPFSMSRFFATFLFMAWMAEMRHHLDNDGITPSGSRIMEPKPKTEDTLLESILPLAREQQRLARLAGQQYSPEVDAIIGGQSRDTNRIEHLLDSLLDFCFDADVLRLYRKLCRYYSGVNPQATAFYVHAYREMWDNG